MYSMCVSFSPHTNPIALITFPSVVVSVIVRCSYSTPGLVNWVYFVDSIQ